MDFLTEQDVLDYLAIDYADETVMRRVQALLAAVDAYLQGAIGRDYAVAVSPANLAKAREIGLMLIGELYENRTATQKERAVMSVLLSSMMTQLQLDYEEGVLAP